MAATSGRFLLLEIETTTPGTFRTLGGIQSKDVQMSNNLTPVTTAEDVDANNVLWDTYLPTVRNISVNGNGYANSMADFQDLYAAFTSDTPRNYRIVIPLLGSFVLSMHIGELTHNGPYNDGQGFTLTMQAATPPVFTAET